MWTFHFYEILGHSLGVTANNPSSTRLDTIRMTGFVNPCASVLSDFGLLLADHFSLLTSQTAGFMSLIEGRLTPILVLLLMLCFILLSWMVIRLQVFRTRLNRKGKQEQLRADFYTDISHEQRNLLTAVHMDIKKLIAEQYQMQAGKNQLNVTLDNVKRLLKMTSDITDLKSLSTDETQVANTPNVIEKLIERIFVTFESYAQTRGIDYQLVNLLPADAHALFDNEKFEKIMNNLISNALKYCGRGDQVILSASLTADGSYFKMIVKDTGPGIDPKDLPHIFERYYRGKEGKDGGQMGSGIGLALSAELATLMGGEITVESQEEGGCFFTFIFPNYPVDTPAKIPEIKNENNPVFFDQPSKRDGQPTLLVVDDHPQLVTHLVESFPGYNTLIAHNGNEALRLLEETSEDIDLIITDVAMPELDGFGLIRTLKNDERWSDIPIVILTANVDQSIKKRGYLMGVDDIMTKPFEPEELNLRCANLIARRQSNVLLNKEEEIPYEEGQNWLQKVRTILQREAGNADYNLTQLAGAMGLNERTVRRRLFQLTGTGTSQYFRNIRLDMAKRLLEADDRLSIGAVSARSGFKSQSYFARLFKERFGQSPYAFLNHMID